jgi:hypothetical protein
MDEKRAALHRRHKALAAQSAKPATPVDVYFVVQSSGSVGKKHQQMISPLYETREQAQVELSRLRNAKKGTLLTIAMHTTHVEPAQWLSDVIMADGTVIPATS